MTKREELRLTDHLHQLLIRWSSCKSMRKPNFLYELQKKGLRKQVLCQNPTNHQTEH